jgi:hypothetical protein
MVLLREAEEQKSHEHEQCFLHGKEAGESNNNSNEEEEIEKEKENEPRPTFHPPSHRTSSALLEKKAAAPETNLSQLDFKNTCNNLCL